MGMNASVSTTKADDWAGCHQEQVLAFLLADRMVAPGFENQPCVVWTVLVHDAFYAEFSQLAEDLQDELLAHAQLLKEFVQNLGRPTVDTLKGSRHSNMKEMRFSWKGQAWWVAFAFDPRRQAILLVGGDKGGANQRWFYKRLTNTADTRYDEHVGSLAQQSKQNNHGKKTR